MRTRQVLVPLAVAVVATTFVLSRDGAPPPAAPEPDFHARDFSSWTPALERGGQVRLVRRLCDTQKARFLAEHGEVAPERVDAGTITTFGPLPDEQRNALHRALRAIADGTLESAEQKQVATLADAREQMSEVLQALKARAAAAAMLDGHYWTIARDSHPRLPQGYTYWRARVDHALADGTTVDVFVPLDLRCAELSPTHDALLALENDLRTDYRDEFNRLPRDDRQALAQDAWRAARGGAVDRDIPAWFWTLDVDRSTWLASARVATQ